MMIVVGISLLLVVEGSRSRWHPAQTLPTGRQALGVADAARDPRLQLTLVGHALGGYPHPAAGFPACHHHRFDVLTLEQLRGVVGGHAPHEAASSRLRH